MLIEILIFLALGTLVGIFTGLTPGIHINLVATIAVSLSVSILAGINPLYFALFVVSMSITHVFVDFIPSVFLGAPEDGTELSVLPGHEMLKQGLGLEAIGITSLGGLYGIFIFLALIVPLYFIANKINALLLFPKIIPMLLILISLNLILIEKKKFKALFVFALCGILGLTVLNLNLKEPLLPLLTGLFGTSSMILSLNSKISLSDQKENVSFNLEKLKPVITAAAFAPLSIFLPALSGGQIATIGNQFSKLDRKGFLFLLGAINTLGMAFSFLAFFLLGKTRTGSAVAVQSLLGAVSWKIFLVIIISIVLSGFLSFFLVRILSRKFIKAFQRFEYRNISIFVLILIAVVTFFVSGLFGLSILVVSTLTGIYCITRNVNRIAMMSCLIVPTIILYLK